MLLTWSNEEIAVNPGGKKLLINLAWMDSISLIKRLGAMSRKDNDKIYKCIFETQDSIAVR